MKYLCFIEHPANVLGRKTVQLPDAPMKSAITQCGRLFVTIRNKLSLLA
jgi:hypothetical protein